VVRVREPERDVALLDESLHIPARARDPDLVRAQGVDEAAHLLVPPEPVEGRHVCEGRAVERIGHGVTPSAWIGEIAVDVGSVPETSFVFTSTRAWADAVPDASCP
jgi:hypothetical protein